MGEFEIVPCQSQCALRRLHFKTQKTGGV